MTSGEFPGRKSLPAHAQIRRGPQPFPLPPPQPPLRPREGINYARGILFMPEPHVHYVISLLNIIPTSQQEADGDVVQINPVGSRYNRA